MKAYELIDIPGDAGIRAFGETLEALFINAAVGMYSLITDPAAIKEEKDIPVEVHSHSPEGLLVSWLNELIFRFDTYGFIGKDIRSIEITVQVTNEQSHKLNAVVSGEDFDSERHERRLLVKAATYHQLNITKKNGLWVTDVIFDI